MKSQDEMKEKKQELELSILGADTKYVHKILDRAITDQLCAAALAEIESEDMEINWSDPRTLF